MPPPQSPTVGRRRLGSELRQLREAIGLTIEQVATTLDCSVSKVSRIETGQVPPTLRDIQELLDTFETEGRAVDIDDIYKFVGRSRQELLQLTTTARKKGWWHQQYSDVPITPLVGLEDDATLIRTYQPVLIPGLLQTEEYARAVLREILMDELEAERRAQFRIARQRLLARQDPPGLDAVLDEAALRRPVGGDDALQRQLDYLVEVGARTNVTIRILPFYVGEHAGMDGGFTIVEFLDDPNIVYLEHATSSQYVDNARDVARYAFQFNRISAKALSPDESKAILVNRPGDRKETGSGPITRGERNGPIARGVAEEYPQ